MKLTDWNGKPVKRTVRDEWAEDVLQQMLTTGEAYAFNMSGDSMVLAVIDGQGEIEIFDLKVRRMAVIPTKRVVL